MPVSIGMSQFDCLIEVSSEAVVRSLQPDFAQRAASPQSSQGRTYGSSSGPSYGFAVVCLPCSRQIGREHRFSPSRAILCHGGALCALCLNTP